MGCGPKAAEEREETLYYEQRMAALRKVTPETWDTLIDDVQRLLDSIEHSSIMGIARNAINVADNLKLIRRVR
jgi:hypothetical protein